MSLLTNGDESITNGCGDEGDHEPHFEPIIFLPEVIVHSNEENEIVLIQLRAKLFRHDKDEKLWKERGTGEVKLLHNEDSNAVRVVMRRDKTLKVCANHYVTTDMELKSSCGSDRAWVWSTLADMADGEPNSEVLAIRFQNADAAIRWKDKFEEAKSIVAKGSDKVAEKDEEKDSAVSDTSGTEESNDEDDVSKEVSKLSLSSEAKLEDVKTETDVIGEADDKPSSPKDVK